MQPSHCYIRNVAVSRLFTRLSPMMFLLFCVLGTAPSLLLIAWSSSLSVVNFYSFILGILLGSIHRGSLFRYFFLQLVELYVLLMFNAEINKILVIPSHFEQNNLVV